MKYWPNSRTATGWLVPDMSRPNDVTGLTAAELEQARRGLHASLALARPDSAICEPILAHLRAIDAELACRTAQDTTRETMP